MKSRRSRLALFALTSLALAGLTYSIVSGFPGGSAGGHPSGEAAGDGKVLETMNAGGYTYVRVATAGGEVWAAGPQTAVKVGDRVILGDGMLMTDFHSETLDRTFEEIRFVGGIGVVGGSAVTPVVAPGAGAGQPSAEAETGPIAKAEGGSTIAELFAGRADLAGKPVVVRGRVVKFTAGVMGTNWIHIKDGSGEAGSDDLTVTTDAGASIGDVILVRGTAATDKDFGAGYRYDLIIEEAAIEVE